LSDANGSARRAVRCRAATGMSVLGEDETVHASR
jgi:hypothetical protein